MRFVSPGESSSSCATPVPKTSASCEPSPFSPFTIPHPSPTNFTPHHARSSTKKLSQRSKGVSFSSTPPATLACSVACGDHVASLEHLLRRAVGAAKSSYAGRAGHHPSSARRHLPTAHRATGRPAKGKGKGAEPTMRSAARARRLPSLPQAAKPYGATSIVGSPCNVKVQPRTTTLCCPAISRWRILPSHGPPPCAARPLAAGAY